MMLKIPISADYWSVIDTYPNFIDKDKLDKLVYLFNDDFFLRRKER